MSRTRILRRLRAEHDRSLVLLVAPAGYGKTSVLVQWARAGERPASWLTVNATDNDATTFLHRMATSLSRVVTIDPALSTAIASRGVSPRAIVGRLLSSLADHGAPLLLVLDDSHLLTDRSSLDALAEFITYLPAGVQVALAGREPMDLPLERWRLDGTMIDIGSDLLAMDGPEARALARRFELDLPEDIAQRLVTQTQGWPALLALTAAAAHRTGDLRLAAQGGSSVADYLRSEVLQPQPASVGEFMIRTSILERLSGPLCDAVLEREGSAAVLEELARSTLLVDDYAGWFRYHPILRKFLQHELDVREPGLVAELHRRASTWHGSVGDDDGAVEHAFSSGDLDLAARTVARAFFRLHWAGRRTTLRGWIQRFEETDLSERPWLALLAAYEEASTANVDEAMRLSDLAHRGAYQGRPPDGTASIESGRAMVRALQARHGAAAMLADATLAADLEGPGSPWRGMAIWVLAYSRYASGDTQGCDEALAEAIGAARASGSAGFTYALLGHCACRAMDRDEWDAAEGFMQEADALGFGGRFDGYPSAVMGHVATIRLQLRRGDVRAAQVSLAKLATLRPSLSAAAPVVAVIGLLEVARLHLILSDPAGARAVLMQVSDILRLRPDLGILPGQVEALRKAIADAPVGVGGASALTTAEIRVLQLLPYYLSFKEIAQRLGVKATTIKTHALSIYGKLGASSRSEAIDMAVAAGLMEPFPTPRPVSPITEDAAAG